MQIKLFDSAVLKTVGLGRRQVRVIASTPSPDRVGDVVIPGGIDVTSYRKNSVVLFNHDPTCPIGNAYVEVLPTRLEALITFAPEGASETADEVCALVKSGVLSAVSIGFQPKVTAPISGGGFKITKCELLEISFVSVPAQPEALVIQRSITGKPDMRKYRGAIYAKHKPTTTAVQRQDGYTSASTRRAEIASLEYKE